eukprot:361866-Chlamydomonas_euryale.AAC.1
MACIEAGAFAGAVSRRSALASTWLLPRSMQVGLHAAVRRAMQWLLREAGLLQSPGLASRLQPHPAHESPPMGTKQMLCRRWNQRQEVCLPAFTWTRQGRRRKKPRMQEEALTTVLFSLHPRLSLCSNLGTTATGKTTAAALAPQHTELRVADLVDD